MTVPLQAMRPGAGVLGDRYAAAIRSASFGGIAVAIAATIIVVVFHDKFWWPPDDGAYAYVAQRMLRGDVLNGDIQDIHAGYVHFIHAAAMALFGEDIRSLRYPLSALTVVQAVVAYWLLLPRGRVIALTAGISAAALSFVLFVNPTANWYALAMAFVVATVLARTKPGDRRRTVAIGALLAATVLLRQLSGVFLAMGALTWLLVETRPDARGTPRLARALILVMGLGLLGYLAGRHSLASAAWFGIWPAAMLALAWRTTAVADSACFRLLRDLGLGAAAAAMPLLLYHLYHGTLHSWLSDVVGTALVLTSMDFIAEVSYGRMFLGILALASGGASPAGFASLLFWCLLLAAPLALGTLALGRAAGKGFAAIGPLPVIAVFFGLVPLHFEIPIYLTYAAALTIVALLRLAETPRARTITVVMAGFLCAVGLTLHAAEPLSRNLRGALLGTKIALDAREGLPRARIAMEREDQEVHAEILQRIARHSTANDTILALPFSPEFYFLADRRAPFRYFIASLGLVTESDFENALATLRAKPPAVVIFRRDDKYNSPLTFRLIEGIADIYTAAPPVGGYELFLRRHGTGLGTRRPEPGATP